MTQALPATQRIHPIQAELAALGRRQRAYAFAAGCIRAIWLCLLLALVLVLVDAAMPLTGNIRIGALGAIAVVFLIAVALSIHWRRHDDREALQHARTIERKHRLWCNPIVNALFLSQLAEQQSDDLAHQLAKRSLERGRTTLDQIDLQAHIDRAVLRREAGWLWAVVVAWLVLLAIQPRLAMGGLQRIVNPFGVQAPFSLTELDVRVEPNEVYEGEDATVTATVTGRLPDQVEMVELDDAGNERQRWPMRLSDLSPQEGAAGWRGIASFERRLQDLREPVTFRIEAGDARSQPITITPLPRPAGEATRDESRANEAESEREPGEGADGELMNPGDEGEGAGGPDEPSLADFFPELFEQIGELAASAGALSEQAQQLHESMPEDLTTPQGQAWLEQLEGLQEDMAAFQNRAQELADEARRLAQEHPEQKEPLEQLAQQLENLGLAGLGACPDPGAGDGAGEGAGAPQIGPEPGQQPGNQPGSSEAPGTGLQGRIGSGGGGGSAATPSTGFWLAGAQQAGQRDQMQLAQLMLQLQQAFSTQTADGRSQLPDLPERTPGGRYREQVGGGDAIEAPDAVMQQVPPQYRDLVRQYRDRVQQDESRRRTSP